MLCHDGKGNEIGLSTGRRLSAMLAMVLGCVAMAAPASYVFGGWNGFSTWHWANIGMLPFRAALGSPANFGQGGTVSTPVATVGFSEITPGALSAVDCFVAPAIADASMTTDSLNAVRDFFLAGGDLLLLSDDENYDPVSSYLGIPSSPSLGTLSTGTGPLFDGLFGNVGSVAQMFLVGCVQQADVEAHHGIAGATNTGGQITVAYWPANTYAPGAGKMVIACDVDMFTSPQSGYPGGAARYDLMNDNAKMALNAAAFLAASSTRVSGTVAYEDYLGVVEGSFVDFDLVPVAGGAVLHANGVALSSGGAFSFQVDAKGTYRIGAKSTHFLRQRLGPIEVGNGPVKSLAFSLVNGDVGGDNVVSVFDYNALSAAFDSVPGDNHWNPNSDLDGDQAVTVFDYNILSACFDQVGDE